MSFKVMCVVSFAPCKMQAAKGKRPLPDVGSEFEVVNQFRTDTLYYVLQGFPSDCGYAALAFATLPTSTADEMEEEVKEAIVM